MGTPAAPARPDPIVSPPAPSSASGGDGVRPPKKRMLIIVNPYATTVSDRLKNLVVYALQGRYDVEAVATEAQNHATEIGREAVDGGYDVVVAFGGDGTLNEVANGLAGTDIPVSVLPGGSTNVVARSLGIPNDVVDATEHLLAVADRFEPRPIDLGIANGRHFVFACGAGLDATAAARVDANPRLKARMGPYFYTYAAVRGFYTRYLRNPIQLRVETPEGSTEGVTAICQNSDPYTYFKDTPGARLRGRRLRLRVALARRPAARPPARRAIDRRPRPQPLLESDHAPADRPLGRAHRGPGRVALPDGRGRVAALPGRGRRRLHRRARRARSGPRRRRADDPRLSGRRR